MTEHPAYNVILNAIILTPRTEDQTGLQHADKTARKVLDTLLDAGLLEPVDHDHDFAAIAQLLAEASKSNRFAGDQWRTLLTEPHLIDYAHAQACEQPGARPAVFNVYRDVLRARLRDTA